MFKVLVVWAAIPTGPTPNTTELPPNDWNMTNTHELVPDIQTRIGNIFPDLELDNVVNNLCCNEDWKWTEDKDIEFGE